MSQNGWARTAEPPAPWMMSVASAASGQRRDTKALAPGMSHSSKKALMSSGLTPAALAMCGRPTEEASPAWAIASSKVTGIAGCTEHLAGLRLRPDRAEHPGGRSDHGSRLAPEDVLALR